MDAAQTANVACVVAARWPVERWVEVGRAKLNKMTWQKGHETSVQSWGLEGQRPTFSATSPADVARWRPVLVCFKLRLAPVCYWRLALVYHMWQLAPVSLEA